MGSINPQAATKESWNREKSIKALHDPLILIASCARLFIERQGVAKTISELPKNHSEKELENLLELIDYYNKCIAQTLGLPVVE